MIKNKPNEKLNIKNNILNNTKNIMICIFIRYIAILAWQYLNKYSNITIMNLEGYLLTFRTQ